VKTNRTLSPRAQSPATVSSRGERTALGETLLLRFLVRHGIVTQGLMLALEAERAGANTRASLVDWMVQRGHISEEQLAAALIWCMRLTPDEAAHSANDVPSPPAAPRRASHLRLVSSQSMQPASPTAPSARPKFHLICRGAS
jgi:hypothetical protein